MYYLEYSLETINKILSYTSINAKGKIDRLLEMDARQYCNLGIDSTKSEKEEVKKNSRFIYKAIAKIHPPTGKMFLEHQDK